MRAPSPRPTRPGTGERPRGRRTPATSGCPHVYVPAQNPALIDGINPTGRWHYGPWFWPPVKNIAHGPVANPYYDPENAPWEYKDMPGTPQPSMGMEHYNDTPLVNGTAYPVLEVKPKSYRLRILNAANDRFFNLQMYVADGSVVTDDGRRNTEVKMIPAEVPKNTVITRVFRFYNLKNGVALLHGVRGREGQHDREPRRDVQVRRRRLLAQLRARWRQRHAALPLLQHEDRRPLLHRIRSREEQRRRQLERDLPATRASPTTSR